VSLRWERPGARWLKIVCLFAQPTKPKHPTGSKSQRPLICRPRDYFFAPDDTPDDDVDVAADAASVVVATTAANEPDLSIGAEDISDAAIIDVESVAASENGAGPTDIGWRWGLRLRYRRPTNIAGCPDVRILRRSTRPPNHSPYTGYREMRNRPDNNTKQQYWVLARLKLRRGAAINGMTGRMPLPQRKTGGR
jgi:hypothetical protein